MPKTNKERLQENNDRLEVVKTKVDDLPKYQNLEPIYGTRTYDFIICPASVTTSSLSIDRLGPYYAVRYGGDKVYYLYEYKNNTWRQLYYRTTSSYTNLFVLIGYNDDYVYFTLYYPAGGTVGDSTPITVYKIDLKTLETTSKSVVAHYGYSPSRNFGNGYYASGDAIYKFDMETETISRYMSLSGASSGTILSPEILLTSSNSKPVLSKYDLSTGVNTTKTFDLYETETIAGVSYEGDLVFTKSGKCYELSSSLGVGSLITNDINLGSAISGNLICMDDKYYYCDGHILTFNKSTHKFTAVTDVTLGYSIRTFYKSSSPKNFYISIPDETVEIGFTYKGRTYLYATNRTMLTTSQVLTGYDAYNEAGDLISGIMPNNGTLNYTPSSSVQTIPAGYTSGGTISAIDYSAQGAISPADTETAEEQIADLFGEEE